MPFKILFFIAGFALWIWSVVDIIQSDFKDPNMKLVWLLVTLLMPILGTILYLSMGNKTKADPVKAPEEDLGPVDPPEEYQGPTEED